jgi:hypothetical protein
MRPYIWFVAEQPSRGATTFRGTETWPLTTTNYLHEKPILGSNQAPQARISPDVCTKTQRRLTLQKQ